MNTHLAVFGDPFDIAERAEARFGGAVWVTAFVLRSRLAGSDGLESAQAVVALADDATPEEWAELVGVIHAARPITHGVALVDHLAVAAATALARVGVEFHSVETMRNVCDKAAMRDVLERRGRYSLPHRLVEDPSQADAAAKELGFPSVVKPLSSTGSAGVSIVRDLDELHAAYAQAQRSPDEAAQPVLVERYLAGPQYSVEAMSEDGAHVVLAVTRKYSDPQSLVELGHVMPAPLDDEEYASIAACAVDVLDDVALGFGPSHTEIVATADGPMPIETHARVGGDDIWLMVHAATGVDLEEVQADQIFAEPVLDRIRSTLADPQASHPSQAVWFGATRTEGTFEGLTVPPEVSVDERIEITALIKPGAPMRPLESSKDRIFKVRAHAATPDEALELARWAAERVAIASGLPAELTALAATC